MAWRPRRCPVGHDGSVASDCGAVEEEEEEKGEEERSSG